MAPIKPTQGRFTAEDVRMALRRHFGIASSDLAVEEWSLIDEVALKTRSATEARIDMLAVRAWSGMPKGHERIAIEIKVSKSDYRHEMECGKWRTWYAHAHKFAFAVPAGLVDVVDVPPGCGLIEVAGNGVKWTLEAPRHVPDPLPEDLFAEVVRRLCRHEERLRRGAALDDPAAEVARLTFEVKRLSAIALVADQRIAKHRKYLTDLLEDLGADGTCECGRPIRYHRGRCKWLHTDVPASDETVRYCNGDPIRSFGNWARPRLEGDESEVRGIYGAETLCVRPQGHGTTGGWGGECHNPHTIDYYTTGSGNGDYVHPVGGGSVPSIRQKYGQRLCKSHALILLGRCYG